MILRRTGRLTRDEGETLLAMYRAGRGLLATAFVPRLVL